MRTIISVTLCAVAALAMAACGDDGGGGGGLNGPAATQTFAIQQAGAEYVCDDCAVSAGQAASKSDCLAQIYEAPAPAAVSCLSTWLETHPTERAFLECVNREMNANLSCAKAQGCQYVLEDGEGEDPCGDYEDNIAARCGEFPATLDAQATACGLDDDTAEGE